MPQSGNFERAYGLYVRGQVYEAERQRRYWKPAKGQRRNLAHLPYMASYPAVMADIAEHGGFLSYEPRKGSPSQSKPKLGQLQRTKAHHGELVFLTVPLSHLDSLLLQSVTLKVQAEADTDSFLLVVAFEDCPVIVAIQRGSITRCTHAHIVLPRAFLRPEAEAVACTIEAGPGDGAWLPDGSAYLQRIADGPDDLKRVASYLSRDPDGAFELADDDPVFLQALEDRLTQSGDSVRLSWSRNIPRNLPSSL